MRPYNPNEINKTEDDSDQPKQSLVTASIMAQQAAAENKNPKPRNMADSISNAASSEISPSYQHVTVKATGNEGEPLTF